PENASLIIAHLNHQLRGEESNGDEEFVRLLHGRLQADGSAGLELRCERIDVAARARQERNNLENVARRVRYDWLATVARNAGGALVATGHTADDQAETVLHRLLRGTSLKGLSGIAGRRPLEPGIEVVRPFLQVSRSEVLAYLEDLGQSYRQDSTNAHPGDTRNRIRHELLPHLAQDYNPAVVAVLCRLAEQAAAAQHDHATAAEQLLTLTELPRAGTLLVFDHVLLSGRPRHQVREMFWHVWRREGWPMGAMGYHEWERLASLVFGEVTCLDLPGRIRARRRERVVLLEPVS